MVTTRDNCLLLGLTRSVIRIYCGKEYMGKTCLHSSVDSRMFLGGSGAIGQC